MGKLLDTFWKAQGLRRNTLLFGWLCDDKARKKLYAELQQEKFPVLQFESLLQSKEGDDWKHQDVYFVSKKDDVEAALKAYSVRPYQELDSGGKFMLGLDDVTEHDEQRTIAEWALGIAGTNGNGCPFHSASEKIGKRKDLFTIDEIVECARAAVHRAAIRPLSRAARKEKSDEFDLTIDVAQQAALHFVTLLFGFREEAHGLLERLAWGAYQRLVYQILGRHFVKEADAQLPPGGPSVLEGIKRRLKEEIDHAIHATGTEPFREGAPERSVIKKLRDAAGDDRETLEVIVAGLVAGTVGNVRAAIPIVIRDLFTKNVDGQPAADGQVRLIDTAREAACFEGSALGDLIFKVLSRNPPAAFLARMSTPIVQDAPELFFLDQGRRRPIPQGAHLLLAMGADPQWESIFGGDKAFIHNCVGRYLAWPLIVEIVRHVLKLPGLAQVIDSKTGKPLALTKRWGVICEPYKLRYDRDYFLNQQPLYVVLPIKPPVQENAAKLLELTRAGAHIVEASLKNSKIVHFAWFMLVEKGTHLALSTVFDGDFDTYVEWFALNVPLFDEQFRYLDVEQRTPIREHPKQFVENIRKYNREPFGEYFFSAYPTVTVPEVINATTVTSAPVAAPDATAATAHSVVAMIEGATREKRYIRRADGEGVGPPSESVDTEGVDAPSESG